MLCGKCRELGKLPPELWQPAGLESNGSKAGIRIEHCETAQALQRAQKMAAISVVWRGLS